MLRNFLVFSLLVVAIHGDGKFSVFTSQDSLDFQGSDSVRGDDVGDIIAAAIGSPVDSDVNWSGLTVVDPFGLPKKAVVLYISGAQIDYPTGKFEYPLAGGNIQESLNDLIEDMKAAKISNCNIDYTSKQASHSAAKCFKGLTALTHSAAHADLLEDVNDLQRTIDNYLNRRDTEDLEMKNVVVFRLSLTPIINAYGLDSNQMFKAQHIVKEVIFLLQKASDNAFFVVVNDAADPTHSRKKREVLEADSKNAYNLAEYYDSDYPVIFNIILWFMVVFGLALLAISYAIGSMDPGRDSIIYRMTSTRMKKDN